MGRTFNSTEWMNKMKVLLVWDTAGVFSPVAIWLNKNGHKAKIMMGREYDTFKQTAQLDSAIMAGSSRDFFFRLIKEIIFFRPTVIHVSDSIKAFMVCRMLAPRTSIVMTYHGSSIRGRKGGCHPEVEMAEKITVTTPDLYKFGEWLSMPIRDYFYDRGGRVKNTAVMFYSDYFFIDWRETAKKWAKNNDIVLTIVDRTKGDLILNADLPEFFSKFEYLLDLKGYKTNLDGSITVSTIAMEAKKCGCKIIHDSNLWNVKDDIEIISPKIYYDMYNRLDKPNRILAISRMFKILKGTLKWAVMRLCIKCGIY